VTSSRPVYQFYGRRKGKPLRRHHLELVARLLPQVSVNLSNPLEGALPERWLEIGFGGGEHLAHQAALHSDVTMIGAEAFLNGVAKALAHVESRGLGNVRIHYGDARALLDVLPDQSLARIYLLYPDPWPKERQKRRRFVSPDNLRSLHRVLMKGGSLLFASDVNDYVEWTRQHVAGHGGFGLSYDSSLPFADWQITRYEAKAIRAGRYPRYLAFEKQ
jgi:tRNA (guanine-N7-)-methyltransferase